MYQAIPVVIISFVGINRDWEGKQANGPIVPYCEKLWAISKKYGPLN